MSVTRSCIPRPSASTRAAGSTKPVRIVRTAARQQWANLLNRVEVTGGTPKQRMMFYSTLFQSFGSPRLVATKGTRITTRDGKVLTAANDRYSPVPYWDTGRNQIALLELLEPELVGQVMQSELDAARERGFMNTSFHGDHAVLMYLGAMERGIPFLQKGRDQIAGQAAEPATPVVQPESVVPGQGGRTP